MNSPDTRDPDVVRISKNELEFRERVLTDLAIVKTSVATLEKRMESVEGKQEGASIEINTNRGKESERHRVGALIFSLLAFLGMVINLIVQGFKK